MTSRYRVILGESAEDLVCCALRRRGYEILARRYRTRYGEIDLVARDGETIVFVEVRARGGDRYGTPAESVTPLKQRRIAAMAVDYLARHRLTASGCRFDVVSVRWEGSRPAIEILAGAFDAPGGWW
jgi:putative endonuclease